MPIGSVSWLAHRSRGQASTRHLADNDLQLHQISILVDIYPNPLQLNQTER